MRILRQAQEPRIEFHGLAGARKKFTHNLLGNLLHIYLKPALAEHDFLSHRFR